MWKSPSNSFVSDSDWFWGEISSKSVVVDISREPYSYPGNLPIGLRGQTEAVESKNNFWDSGIVYLG